MTPVASPYTEKQAKLRTVPLFADLGDAALERAAAAATEVEVPARTLLIERGQPGSGVFVILDGRVDVALRQRRIELGPSEVVGELSLVTAGGRRSARVSAVTHVRCLAFSRRDFSDLLETEPLLARRLASVIARRLLQLSDGQ